MTFFMWLRLQLQFFELENVVADPWELIMIFLGAHQMSCQLGAVGFLFPLFFRRLSHDIFYAFKTLIAVFQARKRKAKKFNRLSTMPWAEFADIFGPQIIISSYYFKYYFFWKHAQSTDNQIPSNKYHILWIETYSKQPELEYIYCCNPINILEDLEYNNKR